MSNTNRQPKGFIKSLQILHIVLLAGVLLVAVYVAFNAKDVLFFSYKDDRSLLFLAIIIAFIGNLVSKFLYKKLLNQISEKAELSEKAIKFSTAHIFRMALLEFPAFICVFFVMQSNNSFYFLLVAILVLMMLAIFPTKNKFENEVPLSSKEKSMLEKL
jgi:ABC-type multidrug transport system fused ATPase/permease subunit